MAQRAILVNNNKQSDKCKALIEEFVKQVPDDWSKFQEQF